MSKVSQAEDYIQLISAFEKRVGLVSVRHDLKDREDGKYLIISLAEPSERFYLELQESVKAYFEETGVELKATIEKSKPLNLIDSSETKLLQRTISASLNVNRYTFENDFFAHYSHTVFGAEEKIVTSANHIAYGRRGAGKSSLLLYALHTRNRKKLPSTWVDMQAYSHREDNGVIIDVLTEVLEQAVRISREQTGALDEVKRLRTEFEHLDAVPEASIRNVVPEIRRFLARVAGSSNSFHIFLDDFHVLDVGVQPKLLDVLYSCSRGNRVSLKLSAIESLTSTWDAKRKLGLQIGQDIEPLKLDLNLTVPDKALSHIDKILDQLATYCGLPSIRSLTTGVDVFNRLVWESAGVPRDALSIFSASLTESALKGQRRVSVNSINVSASSMVELKQRDLQDDASGAKERLESLFASIRNFCISTEQKQRHNAFLIEISSESELYQDVRKLVDLRLLHVIHEGINVGRAGRRFLALILDYGFYVGNRAAKSVRLFNKEAGPIKYKDLRKLRIYRGANSEGRLDVTETSSVRNAGPASRKKISSKETRVATRKSKKSTK